jgi:serine/threonine protein kinase
MFTTGAQLGPYRLIKHLSNESFGEVWHAQNSNSPQTTPLELRILNKFTEDQLQPLETEWQQVGQHSNLLTLQAVGIYEGHKILATKPQTSSSQLLTTYLAKHPAPSETDITTILLGILSGLQYLHEHQITYQCLNPQNIMVEINAMGMVSAVQIIDRRLASLPTTALQQEPYQSIAYVAPETLNDQPSAQSDIWSVGVIGYQLLTGQLPFSSKHITDLMQEIISAVPDSLPDKVSGNMSAVIFKALEKNPMQRYPTAEIMAAAMSAALPNEPLPFKIGERLGPYELLHNVNRSRFSSLWVAKSPKFPNIPLLAVKILKQLTDEEQIKQLSQVKVWKQLGQHPNILPILEYDIYAGYPVLVSEFQTDGSLKQLLPDDKDTDPLPEVQAIALIKGILAGLQYIHSFRIVHRDLAPKNILLSNQVPKLIDFGSAIQLPPNQATLNVKAQGTPLYMSPEVIKDEVCLQSDIWSAGIIFYKALTGKLPFVARATHDLVRKILAFPPNPLPETITPKLRNIVLHALEKDPKMRFQTAQEMLAALDAADWAPKLPNAATSAALDNTSTREDTSIKEELARKKSQEPNLSPLAIAPEVSSSQQHLDYLKRLTDAQLRAFLRNRFDLITIKTIWQDLFGSLLNEVRNYEGITEAVNILCAEAKRKGKHALLLQQIAEYWDE